MFWPYCAGVTVTLISLLLPAVGLWVWLRKTVVPGKKRLLASLTLLPLLVFGGDLAFRYVQHTTFHRKWTTLRLGMGIDDVKGLMGPPNKVWQKGEAVKTLFFGWRNFRPMWEYDSPLTKSMLCFTREAPYVRFRTELDSLLLFGPSEYYFQVDDDNTLHSIGEFIDSDVF